MEIVRRIIRSYLILEFRKYLVYIYYETVFQKERPYHDDSTASRLLSEVKHRRARLVLRWGTTLESLVLFFFFPFLKYYSRTRVREVLSPFFILAS